MKLSAKTLFSTSVIALAMMTGGHAFAQSNISTDSSTTTDTTTDAGMKGSDSIRPADGQMGETTVQKRTTKEVYGAKHNDVNGVKSGTTESIDQTESTSSSTTDDSQK